MSPSYPFHVEIPIKGPSPCSLKPIPHVWGQLPNDHWHALGVVAKWCKVLVPWPLTV